MLDNILYQTANLRPGNTAFVYDNHHINYHDFYFAVTSASERLKEMGIESGSRVIILLPNCPEFAISYFAVARLHAIVIGLPMNLSKVNIREIITEDMPTVIITNLERYNVCLDIISDLHTRVQIMIIENAKDLDSHLDTSLKQTNFEELGIEYTPDVACFCPSKSVEALKSIRKTQSHMAYDGHNIASTINLSENDAIMFLFPMYTCYGQAFLVASVLSAAKIIMLNPVISDGEEMTSSAFASQCMHIFQLIKQENATILLAAHIFKYLSNTSADFSADLSPLRLCLSVMGFLSKQTLEEFHQRFNIFIVQSYSSPETGAICLSSNSDNNVSGTVVGIPYRNVEVRIVDEDFNEKSYNQLGEIVVKSRAVIQTYESLEFDEISFRNGYFLTGYIGKKDENGNIYFLNQKRASLNAEIKQAEPIEFLNQTTKSDIKRVLKRNQSGLPLNEKESFQHRLTIANEAERKILIKVYLLDRLTRILRVQADELSSEKQLNLIGLDSLVAFELKYCIERDLGVSLSVVTLLRDITIEKLVDILSNQSPKTIDSTIHSNPQIRVDSHALSQGQNSLWRFENLVPNNGVYHTFVVGRILSSFDTSLLRLCFQELIQRHPILRTIYKLGDEPIQIVQNHAFLPFEVEDASVWDQDMLDRQLTNALYKPFDLSCDIPLRVHVFLNSVRGTVILLTIHHIACDFLSINILLEELGVLSQAVSNHTAINLPELSADYSDYVRWEQEFLASSVADRIRKYWLKELAGPLPTLQLPTDRPRPAVPTYHGDILEAQLDDRILYDAKQFAKQNGVTLYVLLVSIFQILLYRYTGQDDILIGCPTTTREQSRFQNTIGYFVNTVVLRAHVSNGVDFHTFLSQTHKKVLAALEHKGYPFGLLLNDLQLQRDPSRSPIFDVQFVFDQPRSESMQQIIPFMAGDLDARIHIGELILGPYQLHHHTTHYDLSLTTLYANNTLLLQWQYSTDLFDRDSINRMANQFQSLLQSVINDSSQHISSLSLIVPSEKQQLLLDWNNTSVQYNYQQTVHDWFEHQVTQTPQAIAVTYEGEQLTYSKLNEQTNQLCNYLQTLGVGRGSVVAVYLERSLDAVISLLAIMKAGAAYVPLDSGLPSERVRFILDDAQVSVLLTRQQLLAHLPGHNAKIVCIDNKWNEIGKLPNASPAKRSTAEDILYIIYTSGSTGTPKGVQITHRAVVNFLASMRQQPGLTAADILLSVTTLSFDIFGLELYLPLMVGAQVVLVSRATAMDGVALRHALLATHATLMQATPATWRLLLDTGWQGSPGLTVLCGGEALPRDLANRLVNQCAAVWNLYGPTEATIWSTVYHVTTAGSEPIVPIGRPIANTQVYLLDAQLQPVPVGLPGELYIGGDGVAIGYHKQPLLTAEKFIPDPFCGIAGARLFKTGDLARYLPSGDIVWLGRNDHQVKIHGYRIELGEIEAILRQHDSVRDVVTVIRDDYLVDKCIVAYIIPNDENLSNSAIFQLALRRFVQERLPEYMVPTIFVLLERMPLSPNGKVDRKSLPCPERPIVEEFSPNREGISAIEQSLIDIWSEVFNNSNINIHDNFFDLGGNSILAIHIAARAKRAGLKMISLALFQHPTINSLASAISDGMHTQSEHADSSAVSALSDTQPSEKVETVSSSDFPLANLSKSQLDKLISQVSGRKHEQ